MSAIDCTHIRIVKPSVANPETYRNRKNYFSINVQAACDASLKFTNVVARWPGSTHDARIFDNSALCARFENGELDGILLGDGGYGCKPYLLTPLLTTADDKQRRYNFSHVRSRNVIERCFGVLKQRFQCLLKGMLLKPRKSCEVVVACVVLHNFLLSIKDRGPDFEVHNTNVIFPNDAIRVEGNPSGLAFRAAFIEHHF